MAADPVPWTAERRSRRLSVCDGAEPRRRRHVSILTDEAPQALRRRSRRSPTVWLVDPAARHPVEAFALLTSSRWALAGRAEGRSEAQCSSISPPVEAIVLPAVDALAGVGARRPTGPLLLPRLRQRRADLRQPAGAARVQRLGERQGGVAHLLLHRRVGVERLVAGGVGLPVADVAVELGRRPRPARAS